MKNVVLVNNPAFEYRVDSSVPLSVNAVATRIARLLGGDYAQTSIVDEKLADAYYVPFGAIHDTQADSIGATGYGDTYGAVVERIEHADKAMLHRLPSKDSKYPNWYSSTFAQKVGGVVLPGCTFFDQEDGINGFNEMLSSGVSARFKDPSNTGGLGQSLIKNRDDLFTTIKSHGDKLSKVGGVLEANVHKPKTITIGYVDIDGQIYTWFGEPYDVEHKGTVRFGGNELTVVRGGFKNLLDVYTSDSDRLAVRQTEQVYNAYELIGSKVSRATFDVVQGCADNGEFLSGVTDPSLRPSASSAAEIRAIEALGASPNSNIAKTRLRYDYNKNAKTATEELFASNSRMNILVELVDFR